MFVLGDNIFAYFKDGSCSVDNNVVERAVASLTT
ncbi:unknown [Bacteroides sp. CAG:754]|nr:unknown [Bacteroides sp. CAG:754]